MQLQVMERVSNKCLRDTDIFAGLSDYHLEQIAKFCEERVYQTGEHCATQGETIDQLLIVNGGKVAIDMRIEVARRMHTLTIATLTKGRVCAWSALVPPHVLTASIRCIERTPIISIMAPDLQRIFEEEPIIECMVMKNLAGVISLRLRDSRTQLVRLVAELIKQGR